ncbi:MAG TPA: TlpA disulfide reductase family protein [Lacipirellulaceae bacterium]
MSALYLASRHAHVESAIGCAAARLAAAVISMSLNSAPMFADDAVATKGELPRYKLKAGQELHYSGKGTFKYDSGSFDSANDWKIWVARENPDGSRRLIVRHAAAHDSQDVSGDDASVTLAYLDLFPDGRFDDNSSFGYRMNPHVLFVRLPSDENEARNGWKSWSETSDATYHYTASAPHDASANDWKFTQVEDGPFNKIYESTSEGTVTFDRAQGLVREINGKNTQKWGFNGEGTSSMKLENVSQQDAEWIAKLDSDMERYLTASKQYEDSLRGLKAAGAEADARVDQAKEIWIKLRDEVTSDVVHEAIFRQIAQHESYRSYLIQGVQEKAKVLGQPALYWESTDLDGKPHKLDDYSGKVVVLDFWYRGCGWCIRAMPQINQVAEENAGAPVVVLGMNTDSNLEDAKFVAEAMKLKYPSMRIDRELAQKYGVSGFPTCIIIDQAGVVRDIHVGYSATLREELNATIARLLNEPPAETIDPEMTGAAR